MKRAPLVEYPSSDDERDECQEDTPPPPPPKKRKLPSLSAHLLPDIPKDNPALHQGRRRTVPHVDGQFAAYVYVPVFLPKRSRLFKLLTRVFTAAKCDVPTLHPIGFSEDVMKSSESTGDLDDESVELHLSLTRPTYLRAHQREEFKRAVQAVARSKHRFSASFATLSELTNDERTRTFLTLEVGAGHDDFKALSDALTPTLRSIHQKEFYEEPRFHVSIAWALLDGSESSDSTPLPGISQPRNPPNAAVRGTSSHLDAPLDDVANATADRGDPALGPTFRTIPSLPPSLIPRLRDEFCRELVLPGVGNFEAEEVHVQIGKEVRKWKLLA
ncbi:hypothetical protein C8Q76DRAFT_769439 [Earliella scabrosa]|nr:hypothetical protein C8Q76DRAFT_769439 [Earliella scabrosa]